MCIITANMERVSLPDADYTATDDEDDEAVVTASSPQYPRHGSISHHHDDADEGSVAVVSCFYCLVQQKIILAYSYKKNNS